MYVFAVDPGITTGWACVYVDDKHGTEYVEAGQETDPASVLNRLDHIGSEDWHPQEIHVLVENFLGGGPRTKESNHTLKVIGAFEFTWQHYATKFHLRAPQQRLSALKAAKVHNYEVHATDALAHALAYLRELREKKMQ